MNDSSKPYHLTNEHRNVIKYLLFQGHSPEKIVQEWDIDYHKRHPPSIQTIYEIRRKMKECSNVEHEKPGPKKKVSTNSRKT